VASTADVERELAKMEQDWVDAVLKRDVATVDRILADDFVATLPDGRLITKAQDIEELRSGAFSSESTTIEGVNVRVFGDAAVVTFEQTEKSQYHGRPVSGRTLWTDVFVRRSGTWQIVAEHGSVAPDRPQPAGRAA
jgi:ketosteroid isomerase-like protein